MQRKTFKYILTILACWLISYSMIAQTSIVYSTDNQISSSLINDIYQDKNGFIWVATEYGLNMFDGNKFITFYHRDKDSTALANNYIHSIYEDSKNNLWICSLSGLMKFDRETNDFIQIPLYNKGNRVMPHIRQVIETDKGEIWVASSGLGVFKINADRTQGECIPEVYNHGYVHLSSILEDNEGNIWLGAENNGLGIYNPATKEIISYQVPAISENNISSLVKDTNGTIYVGTLKGGLNVYNAQSKTFSQIPYKGRKDLQIKTMRYLDGQLFIGTDGEGLKTYVPNAAEIQDRQLSDIPEKINNGKIHAMLQDRDNNIWIGLFQRGIVFIPFKRNPFEYHGYKSTANNSIGNGCVMALYQDVGGELFVGTDNEGLYILDNKFKPIRHFLPDEEAHSVANTVLTIFKDSDGEFWIGTYTKGVGTFNPRTGLCNYIPQMSNERVFSITEDYDKNLYFSTYGSGFFVYNKKTKELKQFNSKDRDVSETNELHNGWINSLFCDKEGMIWIGHFKGISCFNPKTESFINYTSKNSVIYNCIGYAITEGVDGTIWAGTSNGLYSFNKKTGEIKRYSQENGLSNNVVCGICEDERHNIWVSTYHGISCLVPSTGDITTYYYGDGLQGNEFTRGAFWKTSNGKIFFGGVNGITSFLPEKIVNAPQVPELLITSFIVSGNPINTKTLSGGNPIIDKSVIESKRFQLSHNDNTFSISFTTLQFADAAQISYCYRIKELDTEWQTTAPGVNTVTYNNMLPGRYTFEVYAVNHGQKSKVRSVRIIITPPWYQSWWAYIIYLIVSLALLGIIVSYIKTRLDRRREKLERQHTEAINEAKLQFFINISHEIRTPMTLIINPLDKLIRNCKDADLAQTYTMIYRNAQRILRLINQLMNIRKIDKGQMVLRFKETDLVRFINDFVATFHYIAENKNITLKFNHQDDKLTAWIDQQNFDKVLMNLLSNAFKYTPEGGEVTITLSKGVDENNRTALHDYIEIRVADTGIGLDNDKIERIFERFYQINNDITRNQAGTGVGLHLTRSLITLHHGTIVARNRTDVHGSEFIVRIPAGCAHLRLEEIEEPGMIVEPATKSPVQPEKVEIEDWNQKEENDKKVKAKNNLRVLIVDDEIEIQNFLKEELSTDYKIDVCSNGKEAYEFLLANPADLVISDVMMPEMDGFTLCKKIKQNTNINHIPVILLTAKGRMEDQMEGYDIGADNYLVKPFNVEMLRKAVSNLLANRRMLKNKFSGAQEQTDKVQQIQMKSSDEILMEKVMKFINENLSEPSLSVEMLASQVGLSRVHLHRKLKELTNLSSRDFIRNIRMQQAAKLLKEKKLSVSEVAYAVGYNNMSHFSNTFKEKFGVSPKEYMQNNLAENKAKEAAGQQEDVADKES